MNCPGCGQEVTRTPGRGRPRRWCSTRCRKRTGAAARRRAASIAFCEDSAEELRGPGPVPWWAGGADRAVLADWYAERAAALRSSALS